jgi:hypothetical protein
MDKFILKDKKRLTTLAASHPIVELLNANWLVILKKQLPKHTIHIVLIPAGLSDALRSNPITPPNNKEKSIL